MVGVCCDQRYALLRGDTVRLKSALTHVCLIDSAECERLRLVWRPL